MCGRPRPSETTTRSTGTSCPSCLLCRLASPPSSRSATHQSTTRSLSSRFASGCDRSAHRSERGGTVTKWKVYQGFDYVANRPCWVARSINKPHLNEFFDSQAQAIEWLDKNGAKF